MGRTKLSSKRLSEIKKTNIGKVIIFCEGMTEKFYFEYFANIVKRNKYNNIEIVLETADGNSQTVLNFANRFLSEETNNQKFYSYGKYLVFDCDDPPDIQTVINNSKGYNLLVTNYLFETWLLMHFENLSTRLTKRIIGERLTGYLNSRYSKGSEGIIREIIQKGDIEKAIDNAKKLEQKYTEEGFNIFTNIIQMNPYTNVYELIEQFMAEISH